MRIIQFSLIWLVVSHKSWWEFAWIPSNFFRRISARVGSLAWCIMGKSSAVSGCLICFKKTLQLKTVYHENCDWTDNEGSIAALLNYLIYLVYSSIIPVGKVQYTSLSPSEHWPQDFDLSIGKVLVFHQVWNSDLISVYTQYPSDNYFENIDKRLSIFRLQKWQK